MTEFEFVFAIYSLVLGLSLVELLTGLGRTLEFKLARNAQDKTFRIGWLAPLLAIFLILDLLSFWMFAWAVRSVIPVTAPIILGVVVFASAYFLATKLVFPSKPENFVDLDNHYFRANRVVFAMLVIMVVVQWVFILSIPALAEKVLVPVTLALTGVLLVLMIAAAFTRNRKASIALLALLIARYLFVYIV